MSEIEIGQELSFHIIPGAGEPVTGIVVDVIPPGRSYYPGGDVVVAAHGTTYTQPLWTMKITEGQHETIAGLRADAERRYMDGDRGALDHSTAHRPSDPAFWMLLDGKTSTHAPGVQEIGLEYNCYICRDPEFAQMGLPLCRPCPECQRQGRGSGHIPADDSACNVCEYEDGPDDYQGGCSPTDRDQDCPIHGPRNNVPPGFVSQAGCNGEGPHGRIPDRA